MLRVLVLGAAGRDFHDFATGAPAVDEVILAYRDLIAVTAVRTGCGDLLAQRVQRFATLADLADRSTALTIEEREDYEPHVRAGNVVHTGVDSAAVLCRPPRPRAIC